MRIDALDRRGLVGPMRLPFPPAPIALHFASSGSTVTHSIVGSVGCADFFARNLISLPHRAARTGPPRASVPERGSNAGPAKPRLEFIALRAHNRSVCGVADMPLTGPIPEGRPFFCPHCGALYSVTDSPLPKGDNTTAKCVVCTQTMVEWASTES